MFQSITLHVTKWEWDDAKHLEFNIHTREQGNRQYELQPHEFVSLRISCVRITFMSCDSRPSAKIAPCRPGPLLLIRWGVEQIRYSTPILFCGRMSSAVYIIAIQVTHTASVAWAGRLSPLVSSRVLCFKCCGCCAEPLLGLRR